ncbi:sensor domain-containing protein [Mycobacteroides chelonae]|uniref:sensor domain-containing protein n=1 Tax=Mycobacteroides chelonae TaxID=1774 RepID=UPI0008AA332F|nr:sensor domain-containing protein [Mycobacteroides chelonae]OHU23439.1 sensor domain-containing protein [Mycobacteroides chelonae]
MRTLLVGLLILLVGCTQTPTATTEPAALPDSSSLTLSVAEVGEITPPALESKSDFDLHKPYTDPQPYLDMSEACQKVYNQDQKFGTGWSNFRTLTYSGPSNIGIKQSIAVYPDHNAAKEAFGRIEENLSACQKSYPVERYGDGYTLGQLASDNKTVMLQYPGSVNGPGSVELYRLDEQVIIDVSAPHFSTDPRVAETVLQRIREKLRSRA